MKLIAHRVQPSGAGQPGEQRQVSLHIAASPNSPEDLCIIKDVDVVIYDHHRFQIEGLDIEGCHCGPFDIHFRFFLDRDVAVHTSMAGNIHVLHARNVLFDGSVNDPHSGKTTQNRVLPIGTENIIVDSVLTHRYSRNSYERLVALRHVGSRPLREGAFEGPFTRRYLSFNDDLCSGRDRQIHSLTGHHFKGLAQKGSGLFQFSAYTRECGNGGHDVSGMVANSNSHLHFSPQLFMPSPNMSPMMRVPHPNSQLLLFLHLYPVHAGIQHTGIGIFADQSIASDIGAGVKLVVSGNR